MRWRFSISPCLSCNDRIFEGSLAAPGRPGQPGRTDRIGQRPGLCFAAFAIRRGLCSGAI